MKRERQNESKQRRKSDMEQTGKHWRSRFSAFRFPLSAFPLLALAFTVSAASNPYNGIVDRNVFSLKPIPIAEGPKTPPAPPVKLTLTGITTILGNKRALLKAQIPPRPPEPPKEESYMLTEGQRDSGVEVVSIDERAGVVKVINNGISETLDFINNGAKSVASAPPPNIPGVIPPPSTSRQGVLPLPANGTGSSPLTQNSTKGAFDPGVNSQIDATGIPSSGIPTRAPERISPEVQIITMEVERERMKEQIKNNEYPPLPATPLSEDDSAAPQFPQFPQ